MVENQGERGDTGKRGATGQSGATGQRGATGESGAIGESGATGQRGAIGQTGALGQTGIKGDRGAIGKPNPLAIVGYLVLAAGIAFTFYLQGRSNEEARLRRIDARYTLCLQIEDVKLALVADNTRRLRASKRFLIENPEGRPGISKEAIDQSIKDLKATVVSLKPDDCIAYAYLDPEELIPAPGSASG